MPYYLVEEHTSGPYGSVSEEDIPFHAVVFGRDERQAFRAANELSQKQRTRTYYGSYPPQTEPADFFFLDIELRECIPGYLWQAADGSSVWYEVRMLGTVTSMNVAPYEEKGGDGDASEPEPGATNLHAV